MGVSPECLETFYYGKKISLRSMIKQSYNAFQSANG
jgi:hypothetical protein